MFEAAPLEGGYQQVQAKAWLLVLAVAANLISVTLLFGGQLGLPVLPRHFLGWAASSLFGFTLVVVHRHGAERLRYEEPRYVHSVVQQRVGTVLLLVGVALCAAHSWAFATEIAS